MKLLYTLIILLLSCSTEPEDCLEGTEIELWGECYNLEETTYLDLWENNLTGEIPSEIGNLTNLTHLYLNNNQLTGEIPPEIGNLTNVTILILSNNQLSGEIPEQICGFHSILVENNQLCPPYCRDTGYSHLIFPQDTSECE